MNLRGRNKVSAEFNMSSMTDIVFLLLIFFMLTSTMVTQCLRLGAAKSKGKTDSNKNIAVSINKELQFFIDKEPVSETELESKLLAMLANDKTKAIILRAEEGVPIEKSVLDIANRNQIKVVLAVRPK
jgi:biopolymer transport protein ExbD